jgi:hypothetical protein
VAKRLPVKLAYNSYRDNAVSANRERNDHVSVDDKLYAVFLCYPEIKSLVTVPKDAFQFVGPQRRMAPVAAEQSELRACNALISDGSS